MPPTVRAAGPRHTRGDYYEAFALSLSRGTIGLDEPYHRHPRNDHGLAMASLTPSRPSPSVIPRVERSS
jgi:hypothetical protein